MSAHDSVYSERIRLRLFIYKFTSITPFLQLNQAPSLGTFEISIWKMYLNSFTQSKPPLLYSSLKY